MLGSIKNLQVIVHLCLLAVIVPANAQIFFSQIFEMIAFDPIDVSFIIDVLFATEKGDFELNPTFVQLGYESAYFTSNMGILLLVVLL